MVNSHQFYKWHSELEAGMKEDTEEKYKQYVQALAGHLEACDTILAEVDSTLGLFDQLQVGFSCPFGRRGQCGPHLFLGCSIKVTACTAMQVLGCSMS